MNHLINCECGKIDGQRLCPWRGTRDDMSVIEWMPNHLRDSHRAAGNRGLYPHNGSQRLILSPECAEAYLESEGEEWFTIIDG